MGGMSEDSQTRLHEEPLVSVVTPFFNTAEYLAECIESVLAQSYQNWEYLLVNNCSIDGAAEIAERYAGQDDRIRVVHNAEFLNQVQNYNHALRQISAESRYTKIVQADDWIFPECLEHMVRLAEDNPSVGIVSAYRLSGTVLTNWGLPYATTVIGGKEAGRFQLLEDKFLCGSPTSIMFRSEIIRSRTSFYSETAWYEDTEAVYDVLHNWDLGFVPRVLTFERVDNESILSITRRYDPDWRLEKLMNIRKFGPAFLAEKELEDEIAAREKLYFGFLAQNLLANRGKEFWDYHRSGLASIGLSLDWSTFGPHCLWELFDVVGNPKKTLGRIVRRFRK